MKTGKSKLNLRPMFLLMVVFATINITLSAQRHMENLDRGLIAVRTGVNSVYIGWRIFGNDPDSIGFNIYRDGVKINAEPLINTPSNYIDNTATSTIYYIKPVLNGVEQDVADTCTVWGSNSLTVPLDRPAGGTTPDGVSYSYSPNDASVGDVNGDGQYEIILKWDPSNSKDNSQSGYTGDVYLDAYTLEGDFLWRIDLGKNIRAGAHYTQFMVYDLDGDGKAEVACKTAPGTVDGTGNFLSMGPAATDDDNADYRSGSGYILSGPEYLTVFNGETGAEMFTTNYVPPRGSVRAWGDSYGNRVDRFLACVAYLDGVHPSLVMCRGYYTRTVLAAFDWNGSALTQRWVFDSDDPGNSAYAGQGNHNLTAADVDDDGKDEIVYGSCTIDDNGNGLYSTGLKHGDALHVADHDPDRKGLEVFAAHEDDGNGVTMRKAENGEILWQKKMNTDVGRGLADDITPEYFGSEAWASSGLGVYDKDGNRISSNIPSINFAIYWDADLTRELLDGITISKYNVGNIFYATGCLSNNGTKSTPSLQADILGDWREEVIFRTQDNASLKIFTPTSFTSHRNYTLMHEAQYRLSIAWQNTGYNQPPHVGYFMGFGTPPPSAISNERLVWKSGPNWEAGTSGNWEKDGTAAVFADDDDVLFDISGDNSSPVNLTGSLKPSSLHIFAPQHYSFEGSGSLDGEMPLVKAGAGNMIINNSNTYSGPTTIWDGMLTINGSIDSSNVDVKRFAKLAGSGIAGKNVNLEEKSEMIIAGTGTADTLTVNGDLTAGGDVNLYFDLSDDPAGTAKVNDFLNIKGNLQLTGENKIIINPLDGNVVPGDYVIAEFAGSLSGDVSNLKVSGIPGTPSILKISDNTIIIEILDVRPSARVFWKGDKDNVWDLVTTKNWLVDGTIADWFVPGDTVIFDNTGSSNTTVDLKGVLQPSGILVDGGLDYTLTGDGTITGDGDLVKQGSGILSISNTNDYTGKTIIKDGTVEIQELSNGGKPSPLGASGSGAENLLLDGGTLRITGSISTDRGFTLGANTGTAEMLQSGSALNTSGEVTGTGLLIKKGYGMLTLSSANTYSGGTVIEKGTLALGSEQANINGLGSGPVTIKGGILAMLDNSYSYTDNCAWNIVVPEGYTGALKLDSRSSLTGTLTGNGTLNLYTPWVRSELLGDWSAFEGKINVTTDGDGGLLILGNSAGYGNANLYLDDNVTAVFRENTTDTINIGSLEGTALSDLGAGGEGTGTITWRIGSNNMSSVFNGTINEVQFKNSGAHTSIVKAGSGSLTLTHANSYSGNTVVDGGTLLVNNSNGSATGSGSVIINKGGTLGGEGTISGNVIVNNSGVIAAGNGGTGYLHADKDVVFNSGSYFFVTVNTVDKLANILIVNGKLKLGGILYVSPSGAGSFEAGDAYKVLQCSGTSGGFEGILPAHPGNGLDWDTTGITVTGYLRVVEATGIENRTYSEGLDIYPNPAQNNLHINVESGKTFNGSKVNLRIYDQQGRLVKEEIFQTVAGTDKTIDIHSLTPGVYNLVIFDKRDYTTKHFIKE